MGCCCTAKTDSEVLTVQIVVLQGDAEVKVVPQAMFKAQVKRSNQARAAMFSPTWRKTLLWLALFDLICWTIAMVASNFDDHAAHWGSNRSCIWRGDHGRGYAYIHHVFRATFTLAWITYQRNCVCRLHQCCASYVKCQIITRAVFLVVLLLELLADTVLLFIWASTNTEGEYQVYQGSYSVSVDRGPLRQPSLGQLQTSIPVYVPICNSGKMGVFSWLSFLLWVASVLYLRAIVSDLQLCGNMLRKRHCCRRFHLVEDPSNAHALQWCCVYFYSSDNENEEEAEADRSVLAGGDSDSEVDISVATLVTSEAATTAPSAPPSSV